MGHAWEQAGEDRALGDRCRWAGAHGARNPQESSSDGFRFSLKEGAQPAAECEKGEEECSGTQCAGDPLGLAVRY